MSCSSHKRGFDTREQAERSLSTIWQRASHGPGPLPCRSYECRCGKWHLTSKARHDYRSRPPGEVVSKIPNPMTDEEPCSDQAN
ncbi:hypothetical protein SEA_UPYO_40 [Gordonia phage Upyo]|nr:hypothetical protein SEA_UPYO_40 [Gordonia phage Upyo]